MKGLSIYLCYQMNLSGCWEEWDTGTDACRTISLVNYYLSLSLSGDDLVLYRGRYLAILATLGRNVEPLLPVKLSHIPVSVC